MDVPDPDQVAAAEPIDVVASAGPLDPVIVMLREFLHRSGAVRAVALLAADDGPAMVDCARLAPIEVTLAERTVQLPHAIELDVAEPLPVPDVRQLAPFEVDAAEAQIASPLGGLEHYAKAVIALSQALGDGGVALATFETSDPEAPLSITARPGDPVVVALGEEPFEMEPDWP
jgi:hypothetical protein